MRKGARPVNRGTVGKRSAARSSIPRSNAGVKIGSQELLYIQEAIEKHYTKHTKYSLRYAYREMLKTHYTDAVTGTLAEGVSYRKPVPIPRPPVCGRKEAGRSSCLQQGYAGHHRVFPSGGGRTGRPVPDRRHPSRMSIWWPMMTDRRLWGARSSTLSRMCFPA